MGCDGRLSSQAGDRGTRRRDPRRAGVQSPPSRGEGDRPRALGAGGETASAVGRPGDLPHPSDHAQGPQPAEASPVLPVPPEAPGGDADRGVFPRPVRSLRGGRPSFPPAPRAGGPKPPPPPAGAPSSPPRPPGGRAGNPPRAPVGAPPPPGGGGGREARPARSDRT